MTEDRKRPDLLEAYTERTHALRLNLNDLVKVKVLPRGHASHRRHFEKLGLDYAVYELKPDAEGWVTMHLWEVMNFFGADLYNGSNPLPIETAFEIVESQALSTR